MNFFDDKLPTFLNSAGEWMNSLGKKVGEFGKTLGEAPKVLAKETAKTAKFVAQAPARAITSVAVEPAAGILSLATGKKVEPVYTPKTKIEKTLLGEEPIKGIFKQQEEAQKMAESVVGKEGVGKGVAVGLSALGVAGMVGLDLTPFGGEKKAAEKIALSKDAKTIFNLIKPILKGKTDDEIKLAAEELKSISKPEEVKDYLLKKLAKPAEGLGDKIFNLSKSEYTPYQKQTVKLFDAQPKTIEILKKDAGIDVSNYKHQVDNYGLRHSLIDHAKDSLPMTEDDFKLIPDIIKNPDALIYEGKTKQGLDAIKYKKRYDGKTYYVEEVRTGEKTLNFKTMYKQKTPSGASYAQEELRAIRPSALRQTPTPSGVGSTIPQAEKIGKSVERGFITSIKEELPQIKVAGQYVPRSTDELAIKAKNLIKDDIDIAEKLALSGTGDDAVATGAELLKHYADEAEKATDQGVKNALYDQAAKLGNDLAEKLTEQGRAVQAASILGRLTPEGQVRFAAREIQKYNEAAKLAKKIPELSGEQAKKIVDEMKAIGGMADGTEKAMRFQKLQDYISSLTPTPLFKKIIAIWKAGLLTGLKTTGVNIFANVSHFATEAIKDIPAAMVDKTISLLFTKTRAKTFGIKGVAGEAKEGAKKGWRYLTTGFDERNIGTKLDYKKVNFGKGKIAQALQKYTDTVFHLLGSEDQPFYYATKMRSFYEQAKVAAINKGLKGKEAQNFIDDLVQNPTEQMIKYATTDAETAVFQNRTVLGEAAASIQKVGGGAGEIVVPFGRTPSAVAMQIFNYSPAGIVKEIFKQIKRGQFDQRAFSTAMGRGLTGTGALALGAELYKKGMVTTARPVGEREQKLWELEGKQPNSIKIGGKWRQIQVLGPVGNLLLIGGSFQKAFNNSGSPSGAMVEGLADASRSFTQQTFLTGVSNFIDAISDPARSAKYVLGSTLASTIPTIVSDIARATDTKERRANEIFEKFQARIPGVRESLEPQVDVLGQERETVGNPLEIMADPTRPSPAKSTPVIQELRRLWDADVKVSPTLLGDKKGYPSLDSEQNTDLWKRAGEIANAKLASLITKKEYQALDDDGKGKAINNIVDKSKLYARVEKVLQITEGLTGQPLLAKLSELKKSGLMTAEVFKEYQRLR